MWTSPESFPKETVEVVRLSGDLVVELVYGVSRDPESPADLRGSAGAAPFGDRDPA